MGNKFKIAIATITAALTFASSSAALADPGHDRGRDRGNNRPSGYYPGPGGGQIPYMNGNYRNGQRQRQSYTYPQDWRRYGRPQSWYQSHTHWNDSSHQDWYRGNRR